MWLPLCYFCAEIQNVYFIAHIHYHIHVVLYDKYRILILLDFFKQLGLVQELNVGESSSRYDAVVRCHPHTVCRICGRVDDLHMDALTEVARKLVPDLDFDVECEQLILYGVCKECQEK